MSIDATIESKTDRLHVVVTGEWAMQELEALADRIGEKAKQTGLNRVLVDMKQVSGPPPELDRFNLGRYVASELATVRISVVYQEQFINKLLENVAVNRGACIQVVSDEESALKWLME